MAHFAESPVILGQQQQNSSASRVEEFRRAFNLFDKDDSGSIDEYELLELCVRLARNEIRGDKRTNATSR